MSLQPVLNAIRHLTPKTKETQPLLLSIAEHCKAALTIVATCVFSVLLVAITINGFHKAKVDRILIRPFGVSPDLEKLGYSPQVVANILCDKCALIIHTTHTKAGHREFDVSETALLPDIDLPETHVSLQTFFNYLAEIGGYSPTQITGEVVGFTNHLTLTIRESPMPANIPQVTGTLDNVDALLGEAATNILRQTHPYILAVSLYNSHQTNAALEMIHYCLTNGNPTDGGWANILWGDILSERKDYEGAMEKYRHATNQSEVASIALGNMGATESDQEHYEQAISLARNGIDRASTLADRIRGYKVLAAIYSNRGTVEYKHHNYTAAISNYNKAIASSTNLPEAYNNRAAAELSLLDFSKALADATISIDLQPSMTAAYINRGLAKYRMGNIKGALVDEDKALELDPVSPDAYCARGTVTGNLADINRAIELNPKLVDGYINRGEIERGSAQIVDDTKAIELDPESANAYGDRGLAKLTVMDWEGAKTDESAAIRLDPTFAGYYVNRGDAKFNLKDYAGAQSDEDKAIQLDPQI